MLSRFAMILNDLESRRLWDVMGQKNRDERLGHGFEMVFTSSLEVLPSCKNGLAINTEPGNCLLIDYRPAMTKRTEDVASDEWTRDHVRCKVRVFRVRHESRVYNR